MRKCRNAPKNMSYKTKIKDSNAPLARQNKHLMKIALFSKPYTMKASILFLFILSVLFSPSVTNAGFFSDLMSSIVGPKTQASEIEVKDENTLVHNSQTVPLLESSINPDLKSVKEAPVVTIVSDEALMPNTSPLGTDSISKQYITSAEITTYTVKKGDTIEKIAKEFGVSKNTLIKSNDSLNAKGTLTVGQVLAILPIDGVAYTVKKGDTVSSLAKKYSATTKDILEYNDLEKVSDLQVGDTIVIPGGEKPAVSEKSEKEQKKKVEVKIPEKEIAVATPTPVAPTVEVSTTPEPTPTASPSTSSSSNGYIWPLPEGAGRISQRLHDDNAVDIAAPKGTPIYAPKDGIVLIADDSGYNGGYGLYVVVNFTDGGQMLFGHMSKVASVAGQKVSQGELIGYVGTTGSSTGNHVHVSARGGIKNPYAHLRVGNTSGDY